jgi:ribosomal protein L32E
MAGVHRLGTMAAPLKTRLEVAQAYRPGAKRPAAFVNLQRRMAQLAMAWRVPRGRRGKIRSAWTALRCTDWTGRRS